MSESELSSIESRVPRLFLIFNFSVWNSLLLTIDPVAITSSTNNSRNELSFLIVVKEFGSKTTAATAMAVAAHAIVLSRRTTNS